MTAEEFIAFIRSRFESDERASEWFEGEPLPGFSGATARQLIEVGRASDVLDYISAVDAGVYS
jgi:hypothetical protein